MLRTGVIVLFVIPSRLSLLLAIVLESIPCLLHVVHVAETLIIDAELELIPVLHDVKLMEANVKGVLEGGPEFLDPEHVLAVHEHFLLTCQDRADELDADFLRVDNQLPLKD